MKRKLIIIRGKPASGKSVVARGIQKKLRPTLVALLGPDYFYWNVFPGEDNKNLVNEILYYLVTKYLEEGYFVILEGILPMKENKKLIDLTSKYCLDNDIGLQFVYLDVSSKEAYKRNSERKKGRNISKQDLLTWFNSSHPSEVENELLIDTEKSVKEQVVNKIIELI